MANNYETFQEKFIEFARYNDSAKQVYERGSKSPAIVDLAANLVDDVVYQNYIRNSRDPRVLVTVLGTAAEQRKRTANEFATGNLESILNDASEEDLKIGIDYVIEPKQDYTGPNTEVYREVTKLQKDFRELTAVKEPGEREKKITEIYNVRYGSADNKDKLEIVNALMKSDRRFVQEAYKFMIAEKQNEIDEKLKGKEADYLKQNLEGKDFIEFYTDLVTVKNELAKQARYGNNR